MAGYGVRLAGRLADSGVAALRRLHNAAKLNWLWPGQHCCFLCCLLVAPFLLDSLCYNVAGLRLHALNYLSPTLPEPLHA